MPPAHIQWQEPLVQNHDEERVTASKISDGVVAANKTSSIRRCKSKFELPVASLRPCDPSSSQERNVSKRRRKRRTLHSGQMFQFRTVNALLWLLGFIAMIYYRSRWTHPSMVPAHQGTGEDVSVGMLNSLPNSFPVNTTTASYLENRGRTRRLKAESHVMVAPIVAKRERPEDIIHIIHTRFMQLQPNLMDLGLARLKLLEEFTLRSLEMQSSRNFLWVIRTDPGLNASLRDSLVEILSGVENHLLIASNENPNIQIQNIVTAQPDTVWSGNFESAKKYLQRPSSFGVRKVLESRLDADDALHFQFVDYLQERALSELRNEPAQWKIWCSSRHLEWQIHSVTDSVNITAGLLLSLKDNFCISPGLTIGYTEGTRAHSLPPIKHQHLADELPSCNDQDLNCLDFVESFPVALRARTPTSAGMMNVFLGGKVKVPGRFLKGVRKQERVQNQLWSVAKSRFGFSPGSASRLRSYISDHLESIAADNLRGQCSGGHSCKDSSKVLLQAIIDDPEAFQ